MDTLALVITHLAAVIPHLSGFLAGNPPPGGIPELTGFVSALETLLLTIGIPLGVIGIVLGAAMTALGHHAGVQTMKTAIVATVIVACAGGIGAFIQTSAS